MDFSDSVILPREDFAELQATAFGQTQSTSERVASTVQATLVFSALALAITGASWGWAVAMDWKDRRDLDRKYPDTKPSKTTK